MLNDEAEHGSRRGVAGYWRPGFPRRDERGDARLQGERCPRGDAEEPGDIRLQGGEFQGPTGLISIRKKRPRTCSVFE